MTSSRASSSSSAETCTPAERFLRNVFFQHQENDLLCGMYALNNLLQMPAFTESDIGTISADLEQKQKQIISQENYNQDDLGNANEYGFFNVQVLIEALDAYAISLVNFASVQAAQARQNPELQQAYIINQGAHWFVLRRFGRDLWMRLNSLRDAPESLSPQHVREYIHQLSHNKKSSIWLIQGVLPECEADKLALDVDYRTLLSQSSSAAQSRAAASAREEATQRVFGKRRSTKKHQIDIEDVEDDELEAAIAASLADEKQRQKQHLSGAIAAASPTSASASAMDTQDDDELELAKAISLSMAEHGDSNSTVSAIAKTAPSR